MKKHQRPYHTLSNCSPTKGEMKTVLCPIAEMWISGYVGLGTRGDKGHESRPGPLAASVRRRLEDSVGDS